MGVLICLLWIQLIMLNKSQKYKLDRLNNLILLIIKQH